MGDFGITITVGENLPEKVKAMYNAVWELLEEGADVNRIKVADITARAGIGKGTVYEYFSDKEELISSAILFWVSAVFYEIVSQIKKRESFEESIYFVLSFIEEKINQIDCFLKYVHIITDTGSISRKLKEALKEREAEIYTSDDCIYHIIHLGKQTGEIKSSLPEDYMYMSIASKIVGYAIWITRERRSCDNKEMQQLICEGLLKEFSGE